MPKIQSCAFNHDTACVDLIFDSGEVISIYTVEVENQIETGMAGRSKMDWLIFNEPMTYVQLILSGEMQDFLDGYSRSQRNLENNVRKRLEKRFSPEQAREIAREFMMYD